MSKPRILLTGGLGFIGLHTAVALNDAGYEPVLLDDLSRSNPAMLGQLEKLTNRTYDFHKVDLRNASALRSVFETNTFDGVIHFAAFKAVGESVENPLLYFDNNLVGLIRLLECCRDFNVKQFVFSSSCTVYGEPKNDIRVSENTPLAEPESPYGRTKLMAEQILGDYVKAHPMNTILLRYFNPVGAHPDGMIGELPIGVPSNLVPYITQTAIGLREKLTIFGKDYPTEDGTCIRDFIHVCDLADAHVKAIDFASKQTLSTPEIFNVGTGKGYSVKDAVETFQRVNNVNVNHQYGDRRPGDITAIFADNTKATTQLGWTPRFDLPEMMQTAWNWEQYLQQNPSLRTS